MDHRVTHVIERMHERLHRDLSIDQLAAEVGISVSRLGFLFRHETGRSPGLYLHTLRMERARVLIESTDLAVRDVMIQVGLSDPSHFSRDWPPFQARVVKPSTSEATLPAESST